MTISKARKNGKSDDFSRAVGRALRRSARRAREIARMHGTPIYILKHGKIVGMTLQASFDLEEARKKIGRQLQELDRAAA